MTENESKVIQWWSDVGHTPQWWRSKAGGEFIPTPRSSNNQKCCFKSQIDQPCCSRWLFPYRMICMWQQWTVCNCFEQKSQCAYTVCVFVEKEWRRRRSVCVCLSQGTGSVITDTPPAQRSILRLPLTASWNNISLFGSKFGASVCLCVCTLTHTHIYFSTYTCSVWGKCLMNVMLTLNSLPLLQLDTAGWIIW